MADLIYDGDFTVATPVGEPRPIIPFASVNAAYVLEQDYMQLEANFSPLAFNTPHPDDATFLLVQETAPQQKGCGIIQWTRVYSQLPAAFWEPEYFSYRFIGMQLGTVVRLRFTANVLSRILHEFYLVDPDKGENPGANLYQSDGHIPEVIGMPYCYQATSGGTTTGGIWAAVDAIYPAGGLLPTLPTVANYCDMIKDANANGWEGTRTVIASKSVTTAGIPNQIVDTANTTWGGVMPAEDSRLTRWRGNIFERQTRYILAQ